MTEPHAWTIQQHDSFIANCIPPGSCPLDVGPACWWLRKGVQVVLISFMLILDSVVAYCMDIVPIRVFYADIL